MTLGTYIKNQRKRLGFSQKELAKNLGFTDTQVISNIERNVASIPIKRISDFAKVLNLSEDLMLFSIIRDKLKHILKTSNTDNEKLKFLIDFIVKLPNIDKESLDLIKSLLNKIT